MAYLIGLFLVLTVIFSVASGGNLLGDTFNPSEIFSNIKNKLTETIFPKSQREITIENIDDNYSTLDDFFSGPAQTLLNSKDISTKDKEAIKKAAVGFQDSKKLIANLKELTKDDKGLLKAAVEKILGLDEQPAPDPTSIPPQCKLVCGE